MEKNLPQKQQQDFIENSLLIFSKQTLDLFFHEGNFEELMTLYSFYYYTAKWQEDNQIKCSTRFVAKGLKWHKEKVTRVKKQLTQLNLITEIRRVNPKTHSVEGWYIKINYVWKSENTLSYQSVSQVPQTGNVGKKAQLRDFRESKTQVPQTGNMGNVAQPSTDTHIPPKPPSGSGHPLAFGEQNALSVNNKMRKVNNNKNTTHVLQHEKDFLEDFNLVTKRNYRKLDDKTKRQLKEIFNAGYTREDVLQVLQTASKDCWLRGGNERSKDFLTPEYLTRIGKFEDYYNEKPKQSTLKEGKEVNQEMFQKKG